MRAATRWLGGRAPRPADGRSSAGRGRRWSGTTKRRSPPATSTSSVAGPPVGGIMGGGGARSLNRPSRVRLGVPCTEFSIAKTTGVRKVARANDIVRRALDIVAYLRPKRWFLEPGRPHTAGTRNRTRARASSANRTLCPRMPVHLGTTPPFMRTADARCARSDQETDHLDQPRSLHRQHRDTSLFVIRSRIRSSRSDRCPFTCTRNRAG
jgi:hypothetical protein